MVKSRYIGDCHPTFNRNPYYWVDDHPLLYGTYVTIGSLDPSTYENFSNCFGANVTPAAHL